MEVGGYHIVFLAHTDDIRVGEIGIQDGIDIGAVALVAPAQVVGVDTYKVWTGIGLVGQHLDVLELNVTGMPYEEALGGQVAPHGSLWVFFLFLVFDGVADVRQVSLGDTSLMMQGDVRQRDILHRVSRQSRDAAAHGTGIADMDIVKTYAIDAPHMVNRLEFSYRIVVVSAAKLTGLVLEFVATSTIAQAYEDGRLRAFYGDVAEADILHHATIYNLQGYSR